MSTKPRPPTSTKQSKISNSWTDALEAITINDDHWWCTITMIVEMIPTHARFVQLFDEAAEEGSRRAIYPLTFKKMMSNVKTLSKIDQDKCPVEQGVFHHASKLIARGENLEPWLVARLVKYLIYRAKMDTIERTQRESDLEHETDRNIQAMLTATNVESQRSMKSVKSKKSAQGLEVSVTPKTNTHLRKRGEERKDKVYMDDAPEDGPHLFIVLTGFRDPNFPLQLIEAGLPLTCVLKIKHPGKSLTVIEDLENSPELNDRVSDRAESNLYGDLTEGVLSDFWSTLKKSANAHNNLNAYSGVIFRNFCPPQIPSYDDPEEVERYKKDLYDRVSCIVYDLYDLQRLHSDYIRSMKLQNIPVEPKRKSNVYTKIMNQVPAECSFISVILQAMLAQVEADFQDEHPLNSELTGLTTLQDETDAEEIVTSKYLGNSLELENRPYGHSNNHRSRIQRLSSHDQISTKKQAPTSSINPKVILECDQLLSKTYHVSLGNDIIKFVNPEPMSLAELAVRSLRDPRIVDLWNDRDVITEETMKKYRYHINNMARCFSFPMDSRRLVHYLHLQVFDKMIHGRLNRTFTRYEDPQVVIAEKGAIPVATRSDPVPLSSNTFQDDPTLASGGNPISNLRISSNDSIMDYHKSQGDIIECPEMLHAPRDSRQILGELDGSSEAWSEKLGETKADSSYLEEFIDVRLLSPRVLPQAIHECFRKYQSFHSEYMEITDSILLCFGDEDSSRELSNVEQNLDERIFHRDDTCPRLISKIVTPVCLRNFCEYVIHEVKDFIRDIEISRAAKRSMSVGELTRKLSHHSDIGIVKVTGFTEDDFILPNSLKGQSRKQNDETKLSNESEMTSKNIDRQTAKSEGDDKAKKDKSFAKKSSKEKSLLSMRNGDINDKSMTARKMPSLRCARDDEPYTFIGYDLGNFRVQLTSDSETFVSPDGTSVKVDLEEWLYGQKRLEIGIDLSGCFLKLQSTVGDQKNDDMPFHFVTENGIIVAFFKTHSVKESSNLENNQSFLPFEFRISWPSGLLVEPVRDDGYENPFYILQRYISKGPECGNVSRESYRKFLRNGTVLKFLDGNEVEVLRPNGTIVRCLEYDKFPSTRDYGFGQYGNLRKDESLKSVATRYPMPTREKRKSTSPKKRSTTNLGNEYTGKHSIVASSLDHSIVESRVYFEKQFCPREIRSSVENAARVKITRYTAVEHDGRHYEVENDEVSRVYDRSLVRTSTDVEASVKFTRRGDGTQSILNSRGELLVSFPDGTRIITGYVIEDEPLCCDWSDEEFARFFASDPNGNSRQRRSNEAISSRLSNVTRSGSDRSESRLSTNCDDRLGILLSDAFVSVLMTCRMEHECYATVAYERAKNSCELSMPGELEIRITREGLFDVRVGRNIELVVGDDELRFSSKICEDGQSTSIYNVRGTKLKNLTSDNREILLVTTDSRGNIFKVRGDGSVSRNNESLSNISKKEHRLFAMSRDSTAWEYIHKSQREEYQRKMNSDERSGLISMIIPTRAHGLPEYRLFLNPLEPTNYSKKWIQKVTRIRQANDDMIDFSRSTYAKPYDWLFPFGRNGNGVGKGTYKVGKSTVVENNSKVLTITMFERIANEGDRFLNEMEKAMACYHRQTINMLDAYHSFDDESSATSSEMQVEKWLNDLALGIETNIDTVGCLRGLSTKRMEYKSGDIHEASKSDKPGQRYSMEKEEIQWYGRCIRERIIFPYFKNIRGSCFLWITNCVDRALELVE